MNNIELEKLIEVLKKTEHVTYDIKEKYFKGMSFLRIRDWLEQHNLDRHMTIDLKSAGLVFVLKSKNKPDRILLQIRSTEEYPRISIFGGGIEESETAENTLIREIKEELNFKISKSDIKFIEVVEHDLQYKNGDKTHYQASIFTMELNDFPTIKLDDESNGIIVISKETYGNFTNIKNKEHIQIESFWDDVLKKILKI